MMDRLRLFRWIDEFMEGNFDVNDVKTQIKAGWYDWFCKDLSLANKTKKMGNIIKQVKRGGKVDLDNNYVWLIITAHLTVLYTMTSVLPI